MPPGIFKWNRLRGVAVLRDLKADPSGRGPGPFVR